MNLIKRFGTINFQRNGIGGELFFSVQFTDRESGRAMIGVVTDRKGSCFVICPEDTTLCWRGDNYEEELRAAIIQWYAKKYGMTRQQAVDELNDGVEKVVWK